MLGVRDLTAIGASALDRSYEQPSLAHAQVSGLGLRLWRGLSSLPGAAIRDGDGSGADRWFRSAQRMSVGTTRFTRFADLIWC